MLNPDDPLSTDGSPLDDDLLDVGGDASFDDVDDVDEAFDDISDGFQLMNTFNEEIENVSASDWDLDADALWGEADEPVDFGPDPGSAFDFPI